MLFYVRKTTAGGTLTMDAIPYPTIERAMDSVCAGLRIGGFIDAWVEDERGNRLAGLAEIQTHCKLPISN